MKAYPFLHTVRARLTLWNVMVLALVLLILGGVLRVSVEHNLMASVDENITSRARGSQRFWGMFFTNGPGNRRMGPSPGPAPPRRQSADRNRWRGPRLPQPAVARPPTQWQARMEEKSFDSYRNRLFAPTKDVPLNQEAFGQALLGKNVYTTVRINDTRVRVLSAPIWGPRGVSGVVEVAYSLDDVDRAIGNLSKTLLTLIPFGLLAAGTGGLFLTRRMLRPLREVTRAAGRIGAEDLSQRLPVEGTDEFSHLASTFNQMLARLERSFEQQRRFTADASHELRTPLTVIKANASLALGRGNLSAAQRKSLESIDSAAGIMNRVVQDLLLLARSDAGQLALRLQPTSLAKVSAVAAAYVAPDSKTTIRNLAEDTSLAVLGDESHLIRLFVNLLENAARFTPADGCITLSAQPAGDETVITVEDTGIGIAPEHLPHVCERFYRIEESRSRGQGGTGLGLAICQSIVQAHGGRLEIDSTPGMGTRVCITLRQCSPISGSGTTLAEAAVMS